MRNRFKLTPKVAKHMKAYAERKLLEAREVKTPPTPPAPSRTPGAPEPPAAPCSPEAPAPASVPAGPDPSDGPSPAAALAPLSEVNTPRRTVTRTDVGRVRATNQDTVINEAGLIGVADGMGGHNGGEVASASARRHMVALLSGTAPSPVTLSDAILRTNLEIYEQATGDPTLLGMGTTLTLLWPAPGEILIGHVGDSRAYLYRDGTLTRQTTDHSMVAEMVRSGVLTEEQAAVHPLRNYITRAVGTDVTVEPEILRFPRRPGDRWLVCSDGLHALVPDARLAGILADPDPDRAADLLLQEALENGGRDNISLALFTDGEVIP